MYDQLIFIKDAKTLQWEKDSIFLTNGVAKLDIHMRKNKVGPLFHSP